MIDKTGKFTDGAIHFAREMEKTMNGVCLGVSLFCIDNPTLTHAERVTLARNLIAAAVVEIGASAIRNIPEGMYADRKPANPRVPQPSVN